MTDYRTRIFDDQISFGSGSKINADDIPDSTTRFWLTSSVQGISGSKIFGDDLKVNGNIYINFDGPDGDSYFYFYEDASVTEAYFMFRDSKDQFELNHSLYIGGNLYAVNLKSTSDVRINYNGPDGDSYLYFYEGASETGASLMWDDSNSGFAFDKPLSMGTNQIHDVTDPTASQDVVTLNHLEGVVSGSAHPSGTKFVSITVEDPTNAEDITICYFPAAVTITQLRAVVVGSSTPSVTIEPTWHADRSNAGNDLLTDPQAVTSETGENVNMGGGPNDNISAGSFLWLETTAKSGTVDELHLTFVFTED